MDRCHQLIRFSGEYGESLLPMVGLRVLPELPYRRHSEGMLSWNSELILRFLLTFFYCLPFVDGVTRQDTASSLKGVLPKLRVVDAFGACIEEQTVRQLECPTHQLQLAFPRIVRIDDRLHGLGT